MDALLSMMSLAHARRLTGMEEAHSATKGRTKPWRVTGGVQN